MIKPILKYPGAKWRLAPWILSFFPRHTTYVEPYCGSAAIFFKKAPADYEILNDRSGSIVNLFRVLREQPEELVRIIDFTPWSREEYDFCEAYSGKSGSDLEDARRFLVRCWQAHGTRFNHSTGWRSRGATRADASTTKIWRQLPERLLAVVDRLKEAEIENRPAVEVIRRYNASDCLIYADPPYILSTRNGAYYEHEMTDDEHRELLQVLNAHTGPVLLSGYAHPLYEEYLQAWQRVSCSSVAERGRQRTECLWLNKKAHYHQMQLFEDE